MSHPFVHLKCHTEYSLVDSLVRVKTLVTTVKTMGMPACAITDDSNLFALVKFYRAAQAAGIKPIIGIDVHIKRDEEPPSRLLLLCQNTIGYRHLTQLISRAYREGQEKGIAYIHYEWLNGQTEGLIALSGALEGNIGQALVNGHIDQARQRLDAWQTLFPQRFYLELQRTGRAGEEDYIEQAVILALATQTPVVATNDVRFLHSDDFEAHEVRVGIHEGYLLADPQRSHQYSPQQYLRTADEMAALFNDLPEALENTWLIAQRCNLELSLGKNFLPDFPIPTGQDVETYFRDKARQGLETRLIKLFKEPDRIAQQRYPYDERLNLELDVIIQMGFAGYFLIVADFIQWAKDNDIPVGPGRGSGAGSLVAFSLKITDLDPLRYELLFERFLNPERVSMPDFDIDFCMEGRDQVIDYVAKQYGRERVSQIITYGTMAAKAVVRDVGRVLGHPYGFVDKIAKLIPFELGITLEKALEREEALRTRYRTEEEVRILLDMGRKLEGLVRNVGTHAGGVVIAPSLLTDFTPLYCEEGSQNLITQFDKGDIEDIGLVKFDFLGLRTLTIIKWALETINHFRDAPLDILDIPLDDPAAYQLLQQGDTTAIFQLESGGIKKLLKRLSPDCFEDIVALVALYRPGPLQSGMVDDFIERKHGRAKIEYPHPDLAPILKPTYGIILYQEQVMQIAQVLANYTLGGADLLRRAIGKKKPEEMAKQRATFVEGATARHVDRELANYIFDLMDKFAGYGFNRSHSAAYALLTYQTAWLKSHYKAAFMAAVLSSDMDKTDKVVNLLDECRRMKLTILPPNINTCEYRFKVTDNQNQVIYYGLGAIKGVGENAVAVLIQERQQRGLFKDLFEFCARMDLRKVNRRVLEALIKSGALDELSPEKNRASLWASLDIAIKSAEKTATDRLVGQKDLFGNLLIQPLVPHANQTFIKTTAWTEVERLAAEKDSLGLYLSGHPINQYTHLLIQLGITRLNEVRQVSDNSRVAGWVIDLRTNNTRRGRMATLTLDDGTGQLEVVVYPEAYTAHNQILVKDTVLIIEGEVREDDYSGGYTLVAEKLMSLDNALARAKRLEMTLSAAQAERQPTTLLKETLSAHRPGHCTVLIRYQHPEALVELLLGDSWRIQPCYALLQQLEIQFSKGVTLVY